MPSSKLCPAPVVGAGRSVVFRTRGHAHGPLNRVINASEAGQLTKPFVFLDLVDSQSPFGRPEGGWHPHSGIATLTLLMEGQGRYAESIGHEGTMEAGDIEWMSAGRGVWHAGFFGPPIKAFQLWIALPADRELSPAFSHHLSVNEIPSDGPARVAARKQRRGGQPDQCTSGRQLFRCAAQGRPALDLPASAGLSGRLDRGDGR